MLWELLRHSSPINHAISKLFYFWTPVLYIVHMKFPEDVWVSTLIFLFKGTRLQRRKIWSFFNVKSPQVNIFLQLETGSLLTGVVVVMFCFLTLLGIDSPFFDLSIVLHPGKWLCQWCWLDFYFPMYSLGKHLCDSTTGTNIHRITDWHHNVLPDLPYHQKHGDWPSQWRCGPGADCNVDFVRTRYGWK